MRNINKNITAVSFLFFLLFSFVPAFADQGVKVLLYHDVSAAITNTDIPTAIPFVLFQDQMEWLKENGYEAVTVSQLFDMIDSETLQEKAVAITFDDGYLHVYDEVFPYLKELGFTATVYPVGEKLDTQKNLTGAMLKEMYDAGWEIGSHSMSHSDLIESEDLNYEICFSKTVISETAGIPLDDVSSFAYPYGNADERVMTKVYKCGFLNGGGLGNMFINDSSNRYYFARYSMFSNLSLEEFVRIF